MEDEKIVELFCARKEQAIAAAEEKYGRLILSIARRILTSDPDAEECLSDTLFSLWQSVPEAVPRNLRAYVCKTARNLALRRLEYNLAAKRSEQHKVSLSELQDALPDRSLSDQFERVDLTILLNGFLETLTPEARAVFVRRYFFFDSVSDIAAGFGLGESKVKTSLWRTRARLKKYLSEKGREI